MNSHPSVYCFYLIFMQYHNLKAKKYLNQYQYHNGHAIFELKKHWNK